jgi:hypothetical protein
MLGPAGWLVVAVAVVGVIVVAMWATGAFEDDVNDVALPAEGDPLLQEEGVDSVGEVLREPDQRVGQEVTIAGQVSSGLPDHPGMGIFEDFEDPGDRLVLVSDGRPLALFPQAARARITGTLIEFDIAEVEAHLGDEINGAVADEYEEMYALLVDSAHFFVTGQVVGQTLTGVEGWRATVTAIVHEVHSDRLFTIEDGTGAVLVNGTADIEPGALVQATGIVRLFDRDQLDQDVLGELSDDDVATLEGLALLEAEEVEVIENDELVD